MKKLTSGAAFLFGFVFLSGIVQAQEFFKGKSVTIIVGNSVGGAQDDWARFIAQYLGRHIPGNPTIIVQNMPGAGGVVAANHVYNIAKPDGLTLGTVNPAIYTDQLLGAKEIRFDWPKFGWIGSPERIDQVLFMRTDTPYKTLEDIRKAAEPPRCASLARTGLGYFLPRLMEPTRTWIKNGFVRALVQSGAKRFSKLPDVPTIYELLEANKTPDATKRVAKVMLSSGDLGRPFIAPPATPADRIKILRDAFAKSMTDPALLAEAKKRNWDIDLLNGEELEALAKEIMVQPPEVIERVRKILGN